MRLVYYAIDGNPVDYVLPNMVKVYGAPVQPAFTWARTSQNGYEVSTKGDRGFQH